MKAADVRISLAAWTLLAMGGSAIGGCGEASSRPDPMLRDAPRWLQQCSAGSGTMECGSFSLACACNVCTRACSSDADCTGTNFEGVCVEPATTAYANACQNTAPAKICVRAPGTGIPRLGMPFDDAFSCYGAEELAGFSSEGASECRPLKTVAASPGANPRCWLFPDTCLPDGFIDANINPLLDPPPCGLPDITVCPETLSCDAGQAPSAQCEP